MNLLTQTKSTFNHEIYKIAKKNIIKKLEKQGIDVQQLSPIDFNSLVADEIKILEHDTKKVGLGIGIGIAISLVTGF